MGYFPEDGGASVGEAIVIHPLAYKANTNWSIGTAIGYTPQNNVDTLVSSAAQHDEISFGFFAPAGTYTIRVGTSVGTNRGIITTSVDGVDTGTIDLYAAVQAAAAKELTGVTITTSGDHTLRFRMATKNASSSSYYGIIGTFALIRTA